MRRPARTAERREPSAATCSTGASWRRRPGACWPPERACASRRRGAAGADSTKRPLLCDETSANCRQILEMLGLRVECDARARSPFHRGCTAKSAPSPLPEPMPIAFKEWAVTVRALAEGEQLITLRKGGIREPDKHFALEHERFFLYPTFDHQREDLVRESHQPELLRALEEGVWPEGDPPLHALTRDGDIPQPDRVRIR